jgi:hypothetical protein
MEENEKKCYEFFEFEVKFYNDARMHEDREESENEDLLQ